MTKQEKLSSSSSGSGSQAPRASSEARGAAQPTKTPTPVIQAPEVVSDLPPLEAAVLEHVVRNGSIDFGPGLSLLNVSEDRIRLNLAKFESIVRSEISWQAPFGVLITLVTALGASDFQPVLGIGADTWKAVFLIASAVFFGLFIFYGVAAVRARSYGDKIEAFIRALKTGRWSKE